MVLFNVLIKYVNSVKMNEKYAIMTPFDITSKILGPYLFSSTARETLSDKIELYFQDHSFVPLFIQVFGCDIELVDCSYGAYIIGKLS